jgi:DNA-binding NtrC family response regulator
VLLVDDDSDILVSVGGFLEAEGIEVVRVRNGTEAMLILGEAIPIDAVVTDFAMPGMSGLELIAEVHRSLPRLPAMIITGYADVAISDALPSNVIVLRKPFRRKEFIAVVGALLKWTRHVT